MMDSAGMPKRGTLSFKFVTVSEATHEPSRTFGPIVCKVDFEKLLLAGFKEAVGSSPRWAEHSSPNHWRFTKLEDNFAGIAAAHVGSSPDHLDTTVPISDASKGLDVADFHRRGMQLMSKQIPLATARLFVQFEFLDGTRSDVREQLLSAADKAAAEQGRMARVPQGKKLEVVSSPAGQSAPPVYQDFGRYNRNAGLEFIPVFPEGEKPVSVRYSFDGDGYFSAVVDSEYFPVHIREWPTEPNLMLMIKDSKGVESGPFKYRIIDRISMASEKLKKDFVSRVASQMACTNVPFSVPLPKGAPDPQVQRKQEEISRLDLTTLSFEGPAIVCRPSPSHASDWDDWFVVQEIELGSKSGT